MRLLAPLLAAALAPSLASGLQSPPQLRGTGHALGGGPLKSPSFGRGFVTFLASEWMQGADLNGDGDVNESVAMVHDLRTGATRSLGHAASFVPPVASDRFAVFGAVEESDGQDHNADGDAFDYVAFLFDHATGQVRNLGVAMSVQNGVALTDRVLAFAASEIDQRADLDGDGVLSAQCLYVVDPTTGIGAAISPRPFANVFGDDPQFAVSGTRVYWRAYVDGALWVHDHATGATASSGWRTSAAPVTRGGLVAFVALEMHNGGQDLNGDGDALDAVVGVVPASGGAPAFLPLIAPDPLRPWTALGEHVLAGIRAENSFTGDLNGDGDIVDGVLAAYDDRTGVLTNLRRAFRSASTPGTEERLLAAVDRDLVAYAVSEPGEGQDLNGDGDVLDAVVEVATAAGIVIARAPVAVDTACTTSIQFSRGRVGILVREWEHGRDLDGDGFLDSTVPHVLELAHASVLRNLGIGTVPALADTFQFSGDRVCFLRRETFSDLNGDGDVGDDVLVVRGASAASTLDTRISAWPTQGAKSVRGRDGVVAVAAHESYSGGVSLNGDADATDQVLFVLRMNR